MKRKRKTIKIPTPKYNHPREMADIQWAAAWHLLKESRRHERAAILAVDSLAEFLQARFGRKRLDWIDRINSAHDTDSIRKIVGDAFAS